MKNRIIIRQTTALLTGIFFLLQSLVFVSVSHADEILIVGNRDVPVNSLNKNEIRSIFLGEKIKWNNNQKISFVILKSEVHKHFLSRHIGTTPAQYRNYWRKMVFTGKSRSPKAFRETGKLLEYISHTGGAVGYIPSKAYNDRLKIIYNEKIKIISAEKEADE